jgi:hypothetical protein
MSSSPRSQQSANQDEPKFLNHSGEDPKNNSSFKSKLDCQSSHLDEMDTLLPDCIIEILDHLQKAQDKIKNLHTVSPMHLKHIHDILGQTVKDI